MSDNLFQRQNQQPVMTYTLIAVTVVAYVLQNFVPGLTEFLSMDTTRVAEGASLWGAITYVFMHGNTSHLLFNMLALYVFGPPVEQRLGKTEFTVFYLLSGLFVGVCSALVYLVFVSHPIMLLGASGALFALTVSYAVFYPDARLYLFGLIPVKANVLVLGYLGLTIVFMLTGSQSGTSHIAHLLGYAAALIYIPLRHRINPFKALLGRR